VPERLSDPCCQSTDPLHLALTDERSSSDLAVSSAGQMDHGRRWQRGSPGRFELLAASTHRHQLTVVRPATCRSRNCAARC